MEGKEQGRILITGGSGFIGTNLIDFFTGTGWEVLNVDIAPPRNSRHGAYWRAVDLLDHQTLAATLRTFAPEIVLHAGSRTDLSAKTVHAYEANTRGVRNIVNAVVSTPSVRRVMFFSSRLVCRIGYQPTSDTDYCPTTAYGLSKVEGEKIVREAHLKVPWLIVRPTSIWGPWFQVPYRIFFDLIQKGRFIDVKGARVMKSFGFVGNTVYEIERLLTAPVNRIERRTFYIADYPPIEIGEWAECIRRAMNAPPIRTAPHSLLRAGAAAGDVLQRLGWESVPLTSFRLDNLLTPMVHDLLPLEDIVGPLPYSPQEGVQATVEWMSGLRERL